jgi:Skp family chaperone for outer membrane proteins
MGYVGTFVAADTPGAGAPATSKPTMKIGVVNITRVIKQFKKANVWGDGILKQAQEYEKTLKAEQEQLNARKAKLATLPEAQREAEQKALGTAEVAFREKDYEYQKDIRKKRDEMAVEINGDIAYIIDNIARQKGLEMVLTCPDVAEASEKHSLTDAMRRMTAPAVWVAWCNPSLDVTDEVVRYLNFYRKEDTIHKPVEGYRPSAVLPASNTMPARP